MQHTNPIVIKILSEEYNDYKYRKENSWHYDKQYNMIVKALNEQEKLNKSDVIISVCTCNQMHEDIIAKTIYCWFCGKPLEQTDL